MPNSKRNNQMKTLRLLLNGSILGGGFGAQIGAFVGSFVGSSYTLILFGLVAGSLIACGIAVSLVLPYRSGEIKNQSYRVAGQVT